MNMNQRYNEGLIATTSYSLVKKQTKSTQNYFLRNSVIIVLVLLGVFAYLVDQTDKRQILLQNTCHKLLENHMNVSMNYWKGVSTFVGPSVTEKWCVKSRDLNIEFLETLTMLEKYTPSSNEYKKAQKTRAKLMLIKDECDKGNIYHKEELIENLVCMAKYSELLLGRIPQSLDVFDKDSYKQTVSDYNEHNKHQLLSCKNRFHWYLVNYGVQQDLSTGLWDSIRDELIASHDKINAAKKFDNIDESELNICRTAYCRFISIFI